VLDASNAQWLRQRRAVEAILTQLELDSVPALTVFNKSDRAVAEASGQSGALYVSAKTREGLDSLRAAIHERVAAINDEAKA